MSAWTRLLNFPRQCFRVPGRGGRRWNLARLVNQQVAEENDPTLVTPDPSVAHPYCHASKSQSDPLHSLATRVSTKLEEGDFRGAVRLACSEDAVAEHNDATIAALRAKHPAPHPDTNFPLPPKENEPQPPIAVTEQDVARAVLSFPRGSAGGPDGLLPQHLKDLISNSARAGGKKLLAALTAFTNLVLSGITPVQVRPLFFGATLTALNKKDGGLRPIAVGCTLRRMVAKVASRAVLERMGSLLAPLQLGFGTSLGAEAAVHSARVYLHHLLPDHVLLKLDFRNAFNSIRRDKVLEAARESIPELFHYVFSCYSAPSTLFLHGTTLQSAEGVQQGDPLGPLLFCLTIHPLITPLKSEFRVFYLDDGTIGGAEEEVLRDLQYIECQAAHLGLFLNHAKTELICEEPAGDLLLQAAPDLCQVKPENATLLGAPIGQLKSINSAISSRLQALKTMGSRLPHFHRQDALLLLRQSFAIPKILYTLRTAPCCISPVLASFDQELRSILTSILNVSLDDHSAWIQATLPVRAGGLGIRRATQLAPSAFLASAAGCKDLLNQIIPNRLKGTPPPYTLEVRNEWQQGHQHTPPPTPVKQQQKEWDKPHIEATQQGLLDSAADPRTRARLLAVQAKESGAWLNALPVPSLGLRLDDEVVRIAAGLRLGVPLCRPHVCSQCGGHVDKLGIHGLSCKFSAGRLPRHTAINTIVKTSLARAQFPSTLEPSGLSRSDGKRPDGVTITPWQAGRTLVWDVTCPDTYAVSHMVLSTREAGAVAAAAEAKKTVKYAELARTHHVAPLAVETSGVFGSGAREFFTELGRRLIRVTGDLMSRCHMIQQISVALQRGNAASVLGTMEQCNLLDN